MQCGGRLGAYRPGCSSPDMLSIHYVSPLLKTHGSSYHYINSKSPPSGRLWLRHLTIFPRFSVLPILLMLTFLLCCEQIKFVITTGPLHLPFPQTGISIPESSHGASAHHSHLSSNYSQRPSLITQSNATPFIVYHITLFYFIHRCNIIEVSYVLICLLLYYLFLLTVKVMRARTNLSSSCISSTLDSA